MSLAAPSLTCTGLTGLPEIRAGDDLTGLLADTLARLPRRPADGSVLVLAQKIVSKAEGRLVRLETVVPGDEAIRLALVTGKDPRLVELVLRESRSVLRAVPGVLIVEHRLGLIMANAGIDQSNLPVREPAGSGDGAGGRTVREAALLLPVDPDTTCRTLRQRLHQRTGLDLAVIISDSFGRPWRLGVTAVAIGAAGLPALRSLVGRPDRAGRLLQVTEHGLADDLAAAAHLLMGQADESLPAVLIEGVDWRDAGPERPAAAMLRPVEKDLFR